MHGDTWCLKARGSPPPFSTASSSFAWSLHAASHTPRRQRSERNKLTTLGVDNRSTATTILAVRSLIELQADRELKPEARKLLSFTDNRQDASLQAGHFNDFVQVALLRSALHKATQQKGPPASLTASYRVTSLMPCSCALTSTPQIRMSVARQERDG